MYDNITIISPSVIKDWLLAITYQPETIEWNAFIKRLCLLVPIHIDIRMTEIWKHTLTRPNLWHHRTLVLYGYPYHIWTNNMFISMESDRLDIHTYSLYGLLHGVIRLRYITESSNSPFPQADELLCSSWWICLTWYRLYMLELYRVSWKHQDPIQNRIFTDLYSGYIVLQSV